MVDSVPMNDQFENLMLRALPPSTVECLHLSPVKFELGHQIEFPGEELKYLYFVEQGMASMTTTFLDGSQVEVSMFGHESVIGISALMGSRQSLNQVYTQIAGSGYRCRLADAKQEFNRGGIFQRLALRSVQAQLLLCMQSAACNAKHDVEQRLARWLLLCADRANSTAFDLSQEFLADMLGSTRTTVTMSAGLLKSAGLIDYTRGRINILDRTRLEAKSCECYRAIREYLEDYISFDSEIGT